jgi:peptidoglycan hydrolase-like protein with peptidoglycan-binding domain
MTLPETRDTPNLEMLPGTDTPPATRRSRWWIPALIVALIGGGLALWYARATQTAPTTETTAASAPNFAEVVVTDLIETSEYDGTLGRLDGDPVTVRVEGTVTALPEQRTILEQGDVIAWVDNQPVILLYGELPVWREIRNDTEGPDVLQLETALTALGFNESGESMTVDETYSAATKSVVETWQEAVGAEVDGVVGIGDVVFSSGPVRVGSLEVAVGDQVAAGSPIFTTSSDEIEVTFDLPTFEQDSVEVGDAVEITMPDLAVTNGVVSEIATVATIPEEGGQASFLSTVELEDPSVADGIDDAPVTVAVITDRVDQATAVPVQALVALAEGGYAVEVQDGSGTRLVAVEPGFYADGLVEVTGDIAAGDQVVVP